MTTPTTPTTLDRCPRCSAPVTYSAGGAELSPNGQRFCAEHRPPPELTGEALTCSDCDGTGLCSWCDGTRRDRSEPDRFSCAPCAGMGTCDECSGRGWLAGPWAWTAPPPEPDRLLALLRPVCSCDACSPAVPSSDRDGAGWHRPIITTADGARIRLPHHCATEAEALAIATTEARAMTADRPSS